MSGLNHIYVLVTGGTGTKFAYPLTYPMRCNVLHNLKASNSSNIMCCVCTLHEETDRRIIRLLDSAGSELSFNYFVLLSPSEIFRKFYIKMGFVLVKEVLRQVEANLLLNHFCKKREVY